MTLIIKTASAVQMFFLAMVMYPEVQRTAQMELDSVVGRQRLPAFEDLPLLPYVEALISELLRWQPATPLGQCTCNPNVLFYSTHDDSHCALHV